MNYVMHAEVAQVTSGLAPSPSLVNRIRTSYRLALSRAPLPEDSTLWSMIHSLQGDVHDALMSDDDQKLAALLSDPMSTNLYYGVDNLAKDVMKMYGDSWKQRGASLKDDLEALLVSVGDSTLFNPEGGALYPHKERPQTKAFDDGIRALNGYFGGNLRFPNPFAGEFGIPSPKGVVSYRAIQAVYQAIVASRHAPNDSCLEIGGGMGRTAYFGHVLGLRYTIIDLPMTIVGQALFLGAALGEDAIWLLGDDAPRGDRISLLPPSELDTVGRVDVVLNVDSLTEMGENTATQYLKWMAANCSTFVSINHEANHFTARKLCETLHPGSLRSRSPYWLRTGYVEEIFSFDHERKLLAAREDQLAAIYSSTSWRITTPLRRLREFMMQFGR